MNAKLIEKIVKFTLPLFLLGYVGWQAIGFFTNPVRTQTAHLSTVFQSVSGPGLVFREEVLLEESGINLVSSLHDDAQRVLVGQPIVELLPPGTYAGNRSRLREAEWEIEMLLGAQNPSISHINNTEALGRDIQQQLGQIVQMSATGSHSDAGNVRTNLVSLLNMRQIATGQENSFDARISQLQSERDRLSASPGGAVGVVNAPMSGFYAREVDGLEELLTLDTARTGDLFELKSLIENARPGGARDRAGRIVTSHNWYVAVIVSRYETQWIRQGQNLNMVFEDTGLRLPATVSRVLSNNDYDEAVIILHSNRVSAETVNLRISNVRLDFSQHEGIRVNAEALRFVDGERGVFTLSNNVVHFKRVDPIYEEPGFLLSRPPHNPHDDFVLRKYDQIIIRGVDLEDGRVIGSGGMLP
ncbi:MAG: hypothetical protein FWE32_05550 [Oscillospiraceae bacterium]|nr:hypothetical protein [Oscillospiraceae bacterium]